MPVIDELCEANLIGHSTFVCLPQCFKDDKIWFTEIGEGTGNRDFVYKMSELEFRPLKTQDEIKHEKLINALVNKMITSLCKPISIEEYKILAESILVDEGIKELLKSY
jgi:hypothetical protein